MSDFSRDWLALREPYDANARSRDPLDNLRAWRDVRGPLRVMDLGAGAGANLRYLAPRLGGDQEWLLVDHSEDLLEAAGRALRGWAFDHGVELAEEDRGMRLRLPGGECRVGSTVLDLAEDFADLDLTGVDLVTASALLDLVSEGWLESLVRACATARCAVLFALSYDGRISWRPTDARDPLVLSLINGHQRTDKGFGPALGPHAAERCARILRDCGYRMALARSDWLLANSDRAIQRALVGGWASAARELAPDRSELIDAWLERRLGLIDRAASQLRVGHRDLLALPGES
jgi:SAM-dependent methyltransferase